MEALCAMLRFLLVWLGIIRKPDFLARFVSDHPDPESIEKGLIYIVGGKGYQKWACFRCPADVDEIIQLSLMQNRRPRWQVAVDFLGRPSIHPSVWQQDGSYAHFWVKQGGVIWCPGSGEKLQHQRAYDA
jgi:hypothetical protein